MAGFMKPGGGGGEGEAKKKTPTTCVQIFIGKIEAEAFCSRRPNFHIISFI